MLREGWGPSSVHMFTHSTASSEGLTNAKLEARGDAGAVNVWHTWENYYKSPYFFNFTKTIHVEYDWNHECH